MNTIAKSLAEKGIVIGGWLYASPETFEEKNNLLHSGLLPAKLRDLLAEEARRLNAPLEALELGALVVAASQLPCPTRLVVSYASDYKVPPVFNVAFVGDSVSGKTPALDTVFEPLQKLQADDDAKYEEQLREYRKQLVRWRGKQKDKQGRKPEKPIARRRYFTNFTVGRLAESLEENPGFGALIYNDELSRLFNRLSRYCDFQFFFDLYKGGAIKINQKSGKRFFVFKTQVSIIGGIYPETIHKLLRGEKSRYNRMWTRFCYINFQLGPCPESQKGKPSKLPQLLEEFYRQMEQIGSPGEDILEYRFDGEGIDRWNIWNEEINEQTMSEPSEVLRGSLAKTRDRAARLALMVHLAEAALSSAKPDPIVPASTLDKACHFARWLHGQYRLLCPELEEAD